MRWSEVGGDGGPRTIAVVFDAGEEVAEGLLDVVRQCGLEGAHFTGIGAFERVTLGFWEWEAKDYRRIPVDEQVEVLSLAGNVALQPGGEPKVHAHVVVGKRDGTAHGGHLLDGRVRPTLEVVLVETPRALRRTLDPRTGLALLDLGPRGST